MERAAAGLLSEDDAALGVARLLDQQRVLETRVERVKRLGWHEVRRAARPKQGIIRALGTGPEVPEYLRWAGEIPHRSYTLNDARALVREVWYAKSEQERMSGKATFLSDYLGGFLRRKFGIQNLVADCAYNLLAALEEHEGDVDVDTFFLALTNAVSDRIYVDQGVMLAHLRLLCVRLDLARAIGPRRATASVRAAVREGLLDELVRGQLESPSSVPALAVPGCTGRVLLVRPPTVRGPLACLSPPTCLPGAQDDLLLSLERFFPRKLDVRWREVAAEVEAAPRACPDSAWVHYPSLFPCDSQRGPQKGVVPTLRAQHLREIQEHHVRVPAAVRTGPSLTASAPSSNLPVAAGAAAGVGGPHGSGRAPHPSGEARAVCAGRGPHARHRGHAPGRVPGGGGVRAAARARAEGSGQAAGEHASLSHRHGASQRRGASPHRAIVPGDDSRP